MNFVKRFAWVLPLAGLVAFGLYSLSGHVLAAGTHINGEPAPDVTLASTTRGVIFGTAAINADGTVASCFNCGRPTTLHLATGQYQVSFPAANSNITANNGFSRWVQVDTLSTGEITNVACATADRAGATNAVFVDCFNGSGTDVDTSFFLFIAK
jgi:hypothetical protein